MHKRYHSPTTKLSHSLTTHPFHPARPEESSMAAFTIAFGPPVTAGRVFAATASKTSGTQEKGLLDWILGGLQKDQLMETDPVLKKVEEKNGAPPQGKNSVAPPKKKNGGGFGGLFAKK